MHVVAPRWALTVADETRRADGQAVRSPFIAQGRSDRAAPFRPEARAPDRVGGAGLVSRAEDAVPVVVDADDCPVVAGCLFECLLGTGGVVELALGVVVEDEQAQGLLVAVLAEVEHLH